MKNKTFFILLAVVLTICVALTVLHFVYIAQAYEHCSIIKFIAGESW